MTVVERLWWVIALIVAIWALQAINLIMGYALNDWFGLIPRSVSGLDGIVLMPLLHGSMAHAAANTVPLAVLGGLVALSDERRAFAASALIVGLGGLGVWIFGKMAIHIGASGLIFGWFGYLLARSVVARRPGPLLIAAAVAVTYGTMIWGVLPGQPGVSWEAHLMGALAGGLAAVLLRDRPRRGTRR